QGEQQRAEDADLHHRQARLGDSEGERLRRLLRQVPVEPVENRGVEDPGEGEAEEQRAETHEDALPQLLEVLDQRYFLAVLEAARKTLHDRRLDGLALAGRGGRLLGCGRGELG